MKSCGAYCVISYLLLIGDRHLDNLMVTTDGISSKHVFFFFPPSFFFSSYRPFNILILYYAGRFFHIDFGFIMGADPKPFPPPMKLCKEMVEGLGGRKGSYYHEFRDFCCVVYNLLRRHSEIFVKMLVLMEPANMKDITMYNIEKVFSCACYMNCVTYVLFSSKSAC
jgi:phosphatidylinositol 3-kinase